METSDKKTVYLSLGSNISPRRQYIQDSIILLQKRFPFNFRHSAFYQTQPYQNSVQQSFINCVVLCQAELNPSEMLSCVLQIEQHIGRKRSDVKWESRIIDIDILLWENDIIVTSQLTIPHYDLNNRDFFLVPLLELNRSLVHPETKKPLASLLEEIPDHLRTYPSITETIGV